MNNQVEGIMGRDAALLAAVRRIVSDGPKSRVERLWSQSQIRGDRREAILAGGPISNKERVHLTRMIGPEVTLKSNPAQTVMRIVVDNDQSRPHPAPAVTPQPAGALTHAPAPVRVKRARKRFNPAKTAARRAAASAFLNTFPRHAPARWVGHDLAKRVCDELDALHGDDPKRTRYVTSQMPEWITGRCVPGNADVEAFLRALVPEMKQAPAVYEATTLMEPGLVLRCGSIPPLRVPAPVVTPAQVPAVPEVSVQQQDPAPEDPAPEVVAPEAGTPEVVASAAQPVPVTPAAVFDGIATVAEALPREERQRLVGMLRRPPVPSLARPLSGPPTFAGLIGASNALSPDERTQLADLIESAPDRTPAPVVPAAPAQPAAGPPAVKAAPRLLMGDARAAVSAVRIAAGGLRLGVSELLSKAEFLRQDGSAMGSHDLGAALKKFRGVDVDGARLASALVGHKNSHVWWVEKSPARTVSVGDRFVSPKGKKVTVMSLSGDIATVTMGRGPTSSGWNVSVETLLEGYKRI